MTPELTILIINAVFLGFAYLGVYPRLPDKRMGVILRYDLAISAAALLVTGLLFAGKGQDFSLILFDVRWWVFSVVTLFAMELPVWDWFRRKHDIDMDL